MKRRVVISGLGVVSPIGNDKEELWNSIENGKCGIDEITLFDTSEFSSSNRRKYSFQWNGYFE